MKRYKFLVLLFIGSIFALGGCDSQQQILKVAASPVPHAEMLMAIQPILKEKGIHLKIIEVEDYNLPNRLLAEKQVDANFFQHEPFLKEQEKAFGYKFSVVKHIHLEPLGIYSRKMSSLKDVPTGAVVAIPSDPTNEARALLLLEQEGLITLKNKNSMFSTLLDIEENPKKLRFHEIDSALLPRVLPDVDLAVIQANFALQGHLEPRQALALESACSPFSNVLVVRKEELKRPEIEALAEALTSDEMKHFLETRYQGAIQIATCPSN